MAFRAIEGVLVALHGRSNPSHDEWEAYIHYHKNSAIHCLRTLVVTDGGGPDAKQRAMTNEYLKGVPMVVAVCTDSTFVRGIVTAMSWFNPRIKAFSKAQIQDALEYLGIAPVVARRIITEVTKMRSTINA